MANPSHHAFLGRVTNTSETGRKIMAPQKIAAGSDMPKMTLPKAGGGQISIGDLHRRQMLVARGRLAGRERAGLARHERCESAKTSV
jgi:hypothetical protein